MTLFLFFTYYSECCDSRQNLRSSCAVMKSDILHLAAHLTLFQPAVSQKCSPMRSFFSTGCYLILSTLWHEIAPSAVTEKPSLTRTHTHTACDNVTPAAVKISEVV